MISNPPPGQVLKTDITKKPSSLTTSTTTSTPTGTNPASTKEDLARYHIVAELLQTETNFVKILNTIVKVKYIVLFYVNCICLSRNLWFLYNSPVNEEVQYLV